MGKRSVHVSSHAQDTTDFGLIHFLLNTSDRAHKYPTVLIAPAPIYLHVKRDVFEISFYPAPTLSFGFPPLSCAFFCHTFKRDSCDKIFGNDFPVTRCKSTDSIADECPLFTCARRPSEVNTQWQMTERQARAGRFHRVALHLNI